MARVKRIPRRFPFREVFTDFVREYKSCATYWYVPKARALNDDNVAVMGRVLGVIFEDFLHRTWNPETQDELLDHLKEQGILEPQEDDARLQDRTALIRINQKLLETLGLLWIEEDKEIIITDAGLETILSEDPHAVIDGQIAKIQYPNPTQRGGGASSFQGLLPHLFLLQALRETEYHMTREEYDLFVNLASQQEDLERILRYLHHWRDLSEGEREIIRAIAKAVPMKGGKKHTRFGRIARNSPYQRALFAYPLYLEHRRVDSQDRLVCSSPDEVDGLVRQRLEGLKIASFQRKEDWFAYMGDPTQQPSWFTYLTLAVDLATTKEEADQIVQAHKDELGPAEAEEIERRQLERSIEDLYAGNPSLLEKGLSLVPDGRQYSTPIGRIDLLCRGQDKAFVIVEVKADEAGDSAFGQILRYIGWVHRNIREARSNVRGIILARRFPEKARYSRIGLLRADYQEFLKFREHGIYAQNS